MLFIKKIREILKNDQNLDLLTCLTSSSLSLKVFAKNFNQKNVELKTEKRLDSIIREGYFGGRVEIFGNTLGSVYHYDFPGMYGICMKQKFPMGRPRMILGYQVDLDSLVPGFYSIK